MKRFFCFLICLIFILNIAIPAVYAEEAEAETPEEPKTVDIWVWAKDISRGTRLDDEDIKLVSVPAENAPTNVMTDDTKICGGYAKRNLIAGEYASSDQISSNKVDKVNEAVLKKEIVTSRDDYVIVTDYVEPNTGDDLVAYLQEIIDKNPNRTIYFPDGNYVISHSLQTSAVGRDSVSIQLSDGAVIKASNNWRNRGGNAMICLGGGGDANDIVSVGSYYMVAGGTLDANNRTNCISIESGRESLIKNICLKNPQKGIMIEPGVNGNSADIDMEDITIIGNGLPGTIGIDSLGCDNTYTNIRIYDMEKGLVNAVGDVTSVYVICTEKSAKLNTVGITGAWRMANCYTENCDVAYVLNESTLTFDCVAAWTSSEHTTQTAFDANGRRVLVSGCKAYFAKGEGVSTAFVTNYGQGKEPVIDGCFYE